MAARRGAPTVVPSPTSRPGSVNFGSVYGGLNFGPTTAQMGGAGPVKVASAEAAAEAAAPVTVDVSPRNAFALLGTPAGVLLVLVVALAAWAHFEKGRA